MPLESHPGFSVIRQRGDFMKFSQMITKLKSLRKTAIAFLRQGPLDHKAHGFYPASEDVGAGPRIRQNHRNRQRHASPESPNLN